MATTITLAGEPLEIHELPARKNKTWRERAQAPLTVLRSIVQTAQDGGQEIDLYHAHVAMLDEHFDAIFDLVLERVPAERRSHFDDNATQSEVLAAFLSLVREAFATGFFWDLVGVALTTGPAGPATGTISPAASGASGPTS
jgi:hypothetical protein